MRQACVYILTKRGNQLFYIGVTSDIAARMMQHRAGEGSAHCRRYNIRKLVHVEFHATMHEAIAREKALKEWRRSEEHTSELQSLMRNSYAVFCLKKKTTQKHTTNHKQQQRAS